LTRIYSRKILTDVQSTNLSARLCLMCYY
jgi:hypothetical protein